MTGDTTGAQRWLRGADGLAADIPRIHVSQAEVNRATVIASGGDTRRALDVALRAAEIAR